MEDQVREFMRCIEPAAFRRIEGVQKNEGLAIAPTGDSIDGLRILGQRTDMDSLDLPKIDHITDWLPANRSILEENPRSRSWIKLMAEMEHVSLQAGEPHGDPA